MAWRIHRRIRDKIWPERLPPAGTFGGKTVLITGATGGLGLAAATHFASLGAEVIMTSRSVKSGQAAKAKIEEAAGIVGQEKIHVMELDMNRYSSCVSFVQELKMHQQTRGPVDCAVLNAGCINIEYQESPEGWEQNLQVNTLSTIFLALLLLPWLKEARHQGRDTPHLVFVSSRSHLQPDISSWPDKARESGILKYFSDRSNWPTGAPRPNYANSKLLLMYCVEEISKQALGPDGTPEIIVNSICPGIVYTDIARNIATQSLFKQYSTPVYLSSVGKCADYGARWYLIAAMSSPDKHGKFMESLDTEEEYDELSFPVLGSDNAKEVQQLVWNEVHGELSARII
ncbi:NAD(P)-binding protein [Xylariaceae sp. FL0016]|nr:NAD(P)-binding protein [Xylariaceae sp. FL0016]